jgi:hypothetical protein
LATRRWPLLDRVMGGPSHRQSLLMCSTSCGVGKGGDEEQAARSRKTLSGRASWVGTDEWA